MARSRHSDKHIESVCQYAESLGWTITTGGSHAWGIMWCPIGERGGCHYSIWSTPKVPMNHARHLRNKVDKCICCMNAETEEGRADG